MFDPISLALNPPRFVKRDIRLRPSRAEPSKPLVWPLPRLAGRDPVAVPVGEDERGAVDIGYGGHDFGGPLFVPVFAVQRGDVTFACETSSGFAIFLDHGAWETQYGHLDQMFVNKNVSRTRRLQHVEAGQVIGYATKAPVHIRFALLEKTYMQGWKPVDPLPQLKEWIVSAVPDELRTLRPPTPDQKAA